LDAKNKRFNLVLVYKLDRFSRRLKDLISIVDELKERGVAFKSATEPFDTTTSTGNLMFQQLGSFAEFERNRIIERVFPGMVKGVEKGNWQGSRYAPYGYYYNKGRKLLEVVEKEADIIRLIFAMYLSGQSTTQIAGYLYKKSYKTRSGGKFNTHLVGCILKNQVYLGKLVWNRHHYDKTKKTLKGNRYIKNDSSKIIVAEGRHKPIIAQKDFDAVQSKLEQNRKGVAHRKGCKEYPLTGILYCAECGHRFQGCLSTARRENKKTKAKRRYYRCCGRIVHYVKCNNDYVRADQIEKIVYCILETVFSGDIDEARLQMLVKSTSVSCSDELKEKLAEANKKLEVNYVEQEKLGKIFSQGKLAEKVYNRLITPLLDEQRDIEERIRKLKLNLIERERSIEYQQLLKSVVNHLDAIETEMDLAGKRGLLKLIFKAIRIDKGRVKDFELYEPFKSLYEGVKIECQLKENQEVTTIPESVSTYVLSDVK